MVKPLERDVTREQAELFFDIDSSVPKNQRYRLILLPASGTAQPFETEEEVSEFMLWANQRWLKNETW